MGLFEDILEGFFKIIEFIAEAIRAVFVLVGGIVEFIGKEILPTIAVIFTLVGLSIAVLSIFAPLVAVQVINFLVYGVSYIGGQVGLMINTGPVAVKTAMIGLKTVIATFLEAIHFRAIMAVHNLLWILSEDYRKMVSGLFKQMSEVSEQLFGWTLGMQVILNNTRTIVLSSASILGYNYDIAQLVWFQNLSDMLGVINEKAEIYMEDPQQFFLDLEEMVEKNAIDISAGASQLIYESTLSMTTAIESTAVNMIRIDTATQQNTMTTRSLTNQNFGGRIRATNKVFTGFKQDEYAPTKKRQDDSIEINRAQTAKNRHETARLARKMTTPTGQIDEIDDLPETEKAFEEEKLEDLATRPHQEDSEQLTEEQETSTAEHDKELEQAEKAAELEETIQPGKPQPATDIEIKPRPTVNAWFVGDY